MHLECFNCSYCKKPIYHYYCFDNDSRPCHIDCYTQNSFEKCGFCDDYIMEDYHYNYKGSKLHMLCHQELSNDEKLKIGFKEHKVIQSIANKQQH